MSAIQNLRVTTAPTAEPLDLASAKAHLRVDHTSEDTLIAALISAARLWAEQQTGRALAPTTYEYSLDDWPAADAITLPMPPLTSVTSLKWLDGDGTETTLTEDTDYLVDDGNTPGRIVLPYGESWPSGSLYPVRPVRATYVAGYPDYAGTVNTDGTAVTWASGDKFSTAWTAGHPFIIAGVVYSVASVTSDSALTLSATAGTQTGATYSASDIPMPIRQAMLLRIGDLYEHREETLLGSTLQSTRAAEWLLAPYIVWQSYGEANKS